MLARIASTMRKFGKVVELHTIVSRKVISETTICNPSTAERRLSLFPGSIDSNIRSSSFVKDFPSSNPHECWIPKILDISISRNFK